MCKLASMYVLRDRVLWSKTSDSHAMIASEHTLYGQSPESVVSGRLWAVPVEVTPPDQDYRLPLERWKMQLDEVVRFTFLPDWWDENDVRRRCAAALMKWARHHIVRSGKHERSGEVSLIVLGEAEVTVTGQTGGVCWAYEHAILNVLRQGGGSCAALDHTVLNANGQTGGNCLVYDDAVLNATGQRGGVCAAYDRAVLNASGQTGGDCWACDDAVLNATGQTGGVCWAREHAVLNVSGQRGGVCRQIG